MSILFVNGSPNKTGNTAALYGMTYGGMATNRADAAALRKTV